jgi:hypothetical protein
LATNTARWSSSCAEVRASKSDANTAPTNTNVKLDAFRYILNEAKKIRKSVVR